MVTENYVCVHVYIYICIHTLIYIHIYIYIHKCRSTCASVSTCTDETNPTPHGPRSVDPTCSEARRASHPRLLVVLCRGSKTPAAGVWARGGKFLGLWVSELRCVSLNPKP